jgi:CheY-like chemotaxis protein
MTSSGELRPIEILMIEDNPGDVRLTQEAFRDGRIRNHLNVVDDGEKAMAYLRREGPYADKPRPDLILLDLNLPRRDGRDVLSELKRDPDLLRIPVVVLTTSQSDEDILRSYDLHANCYVTKPFEFQNFLDVVRMIEHFWLSVVSLPSTHTHAG